MSDLIERLHVHGEALATAYQSRDFEEVMMQVDEELVSFAVCEMDEAADALEAKDKLIAELVEVLADSRGDVFNWLDEIYKFETDTGAGEHPRIDAIDALILRAKEQE